MAALYATLAEFRAFRVWRVAGHGGSREIDFRWYFVRGGFIRTQRETYFGLKVLGRDALVAMIVSTMQAKLDAAASE
ncbi:MAG: hypothetical protein ABJE47_22715 [bacterium]